MGQVFAGTSGWSYPKWKPAFYPAKLPPGRFLEHYSSILNAVEVNATFRRLVSENAMEKWARATPEHFRLTLKAHQRITHFLRLREVEDFIRLFYRSLNPLMVAEKLGAVLYQLPPNFKSDVPLLNDFLFQLPRRARAAIEFRDRSWFSERVYNVLSEHNVALCVAESETLETPDIVTADFSYYRFRKPEYSPRALRQIAERLRQRSIARRDVYAFFKHEEDPRSALNAVRVLQYVQSKAA